MVGYCLYKAGELYKSNSITISHNWPLEQMFHPLRNLGTEPNGKATEKNYLFWYTINYCTNNENSKYTWIVHVIKLFGSLVETSSLFLG